MAPYNGAVRLVPRYLLTYSKRASSNVTRAILGVSRSVRWAHASGSPKPLFTHLRRHDFGQIGVSVDSSSVILRAHGKKNNAVLNSFWLRDNCQCDKCVNQATMQRNYDTFDIPEDITATRATLTDGALEVLWSDSHVSRYSMLWLERAMRTERDPILADIQKHTYFNADTAFDPPEIPYAYVMKQPQGMANLTSAIRNRGFCFITAAPPTPHTTKALLEKIGPIRNTHYGGFYDFTADLAMADTAYTNIALPAHTDTTYFTEPAGLQAFHMLSHKPPPGYSFAESLRLGGESLLVDGFRAASIMQKQHPREYEFLCTYPIPWHASGNKDVSVTPYTRFPVIETTTGGASGRVRRIRWNNDDRGSVPGGVSSETAGRWYKAARIWNQILTDKESELWLTLNPSKILIFDNWRVLHGRGSFEGSRRMCGAYISRDDFDSRWKMTNWKRDYVLSHNYFLDLKDGQRETSYLPKDNAGEYFQELKNDFGGDKAETTVPSEAATVPEDAEIVVPLITGTPEDGSARSEADKVI